MQYGGRHAGYKVSQVLPATVSVKITEDLPNGPYGNMSITGGSELFVPPGYRYSQTKEALLKAWIEGRGSQMNMEFQGALGVKSTYEEQWEVKEIKFKGGPVDMDAETAEGDHMVSMAILQKTGVKCCGCCTII